MNIQLSGHFVRRYKERVGHYSVAAVKRKLTEALKEFPPNTILCKFTIKDIWVVAKRKESGAWIIKTCGRNYGKNTFADTKKTAAGSL